MHNIEDTVREYLIERGWDKLRPSDLAKSIIIEAAELLEIFQWSSLTIEETKQDEKRMAEIKKELADVFIYCLDMAVLLDLDTEKIIMDKLEHIKNKYPAELMRKDAKHETGSGNSDLYLGIKQEYRRKGQS
ncbi:MAG TPA: nucleotide pyrophosphohydrolase [Patescibacteria group bacterium]|jgi:dCTP diphosphatase|nr:nucleotide pyrophosphohydrolase [Patescibacteria group bacterium]